MQNNVELTYRKKIYHYIIYSILMLILLILILLINIHQGAMKISISDVSSIIIGKITNSQSILANVPENLIAIVWEIRLPRILCGIFVGMGLAVAGVIFQGILLNPLSDPYTLGVSTGAAFGASLAIYFNVCFGLLLPVTPFALLFAFLTLICVIFISQHGGGLLSSNLIIAGIIVSSILSSGISFIKMLAGESVSAIVFWLMGSLSSRNWEDAAVVVPAVTICIILAFLFANDLNIMALGDKNAQALGINTGLIRGFYLILGSIITAVCVSTCGIIGFIGLIIPHILRYWLTSDNKVLIILSALSGGLLLALADNATRLLFASEIPIGILTTLLGGPFFIFIFTRHKKGGTAIHE